MIKLASPDAETLLSGLGSWALPMSAVGAAGMGAANLLSPADDPDHPEQKKRSLLNSMLLGASLGGVAGAGGRAAVNWWKPEIADEAGMGLNTLFGNTAKSQFHEPSPWVTMLGARPGVTALVGGGLGTSVGAGGGFVKKVWDKGTAAEMADKATHASPPDIEGFMKNPDKAALREMLENAKKSGKVNDFTGTEKLLSAKSGKSSIKGGVLGGLAGLLGGWGVGEFAHSGLENAAKVHAVAPDTSALLNAARQAKEQLPTPQ
jgi:hypothetical protein